LGYYRGNQMRIPNSGPVGPAQSVHGKIFWREFFKRPKLGLALYKGFFLAYSSPCGEL